MTERLDYLNAYRQHFDAQVLAIEDRAGVPAVLLDRTCFYPTSGGQLHDTGLLGGAPVVNVVAEEGEIWHLLAASPPFAAGERVVGEIDWPRRYDHMQQHSGQHLLSQLIHQRYGFETVSVHFGREESTLDLNTAETPPAFLSEIEQAANELAYLGLEIRAYFVDEQEVGRLPLRRPPAVAGPIRIVEIDGYDYSACGGTHVRTTAEIVPIKLLRSERRRNQTRLTFLCGLRACRDYAEKHRLLAQTAGLFSTEMAAVPTMVQRLQAQMRELEYKHMELQKRLLSREAATLVAAAPRAGDVAIVEYLSPDASVEMLKHMAALLREQPKCVGLLASISEDNATLVFCRSDDVQLHIGEVLRHALAAFGGRGGGRPEYAQGGGVHATAVSAVLAKARRRCEETLEGHG
ncbi:MAG: DHHA1 domain-containing protein [Caldilinea sp.]|nr:DHHA1 domain-containing protein [Caldilinea sp.]MDW8441212.1 DHHA1 domain-containing protein [Caldilineaceae bacterium]